MGVSGQRHVPAALYPRGKNSRYIGQEAGLSPKPVWTQRLEEKNSVGDRTPVVQSVVSHYTELPRLLIEIRKSTKYKAFV
jgi:hypothetical protein